ncbi:hypothetical protein NDU88_008927 [Pleurodeles waltl]|uniref:Uncharacterized protein n=1 Tax=Pleurodeles waltl TaxID=8319 RepID=A0AAV7PQX1_PLEWA|nr:hypothetical protein NDU88_008927 [Pleurodeles waltl]
MLADIRKSLATLAVPSLVPVVQPLPQAQATQVAQVVQMEACPTPQVTTQDLTAQALLVVPQLLANINTSATPPSTTPWTTNDSLQNSVAELKRQVDALAAARSVPPLQTAAVGPGVTSAPCALPPATPLEKSKVAEMTKD